MHFLLVAWLAAGEVEPFPVYKLELGRDGALLATGAAMWAAYFLTDREAKLDPCGAHLPGGACDPASVNALDSIALHNSSDAANTASDVTRTLAMAWPAFVDAYLLTQPYSDKERGLLFEGLVYGEVILISTAADTLLKQGVLRLRPYVYSSPAFPEGTLRDRNDFWSFPSGHATTAFAGATFACTTLVRRAHVNANGLLIGCGPGFVLAIATGILRVEAGQHFPTDVLAGSAIGAGIGIGVPLLHKNPNSEPLRAMPMLVPVNGGLVLSLTGLL
jgi:membrane-associated phospholipid phosphatase